MTTDSASLANVFGPVFKKAAETATDEKARLQDQIKRLHEQREEIDRQILELKNKAEKIDENVAVALKHAANEAGVRLEINGGTTRRGRTGGRMSQSEIAEAIDAVIEILPSNNNRYVSVKSISEKTGLETDQIRSVLAKLKREGRAISNGMRGPSGGWRRIS